MVEHFGLKGEYIEHIDRNVAHFFGNMGKRPMNERTEKMRKKTENINASISS